MKFEMDYPDFATPSLQKDYNIHTVQFGEEAVIFSAPMNHSEFEKIMSSPRKSNEVFVESITIDKYQASVFKTKHGNNQLSQSYKVMFFANDHLYTIFMIKPDFGKKMLQSFRVLL
jgi:hypothetical protein